MSEYLTPTYATDLTMKLHASAQADGVQLQVRGVNLAQQPTTVTDAGMKILLVAELPDGTRTELGVVTHPYSVTVPRGSLPAAGWVNLTGEVLSGNASGRFRTNPHHLGAGGSPKVPLPGIRAMSAQYDAGCADWLPAIERFAKPSSPPYRLKTMPSQNGVAPTKWVSERPWGMGVHATESFPRWRRIGGAVQSEPIKGGANTAQLPEIISSNPHWATVGAEPGVSNVTPISTVHGHPSGGRGPLYIGLDGYGRFWGYNRDGTITGMGGNEMPADPYEVSDATLSNWRPVGEFPDGRLLHPHDFSYDYEDRKWIYVADTGNNRLVRIDRRVVAGQREDFSRWVFRRWGPAFRTPTSVNSLHGFGLVVVDADGLWRVDKTSGAATLVFRHPDLFWCSFISTGEVCVISRASVIYRVNLQSGTATQIANLNKRHEWPVISPDIGGHIGPRDALYVINGHYASYRVDQDGTIHGTLNSGPYYFPEKGGYMSIGDLRRCQEMHHYSWNMEVHPEEPYVFNNSQAWTMPNIVRPMQPGEEYMSDTSPLASIGHYLMRRGTVEGFPWGSRPSFTALRSSHGYSGLGVKSFDEIQDMPLADRVAYLRAGMGGAVARPELVGDHLRGLLYWVWRNSRQFLEGAALELPPPVADRRAPFITDVRVASSGDRVTWTFTTDRPALCYVRFGPALPMHRWTPLETSFGASHTAVARYVDGPVHYQICALGDNGVLTEAAVGRSDGALDATPPQAPARLRVA